MYKGKKISLILPTFNEKDSIKKVINEFEELEIVDEILVINNNAAKGTSYEIAGTSAIEIMESEQGYGSAIIRGFKESRGDLIVVCEPDDTFLATASRTYKELIWSGANMGWFLRFGNWVVAKLLEVLFNTNTLTDVGCTYRLVHRNVILELLPLFKIKSNFFGPEMMALGYIRKYKCIQIPVVYKERIGTSSVTGNLLKAFTLGIKMILLLFTLKLRIDRTVLKFLK